MDAREVGTGKITVIVLRDGQAPSITEVQESDLSKTVEVAIPINIHATAEVKDEEPGMIKGAAIAVGDTVTTTGKGTITAARKFFGGITGMIRSGGRAVKEGFKEGADEYDMRREEKRKEKELRKQCLAKAEEMVKSEKHEPKL